MMNRFSHIAFLTLALLISSTHLMGSHLVGSEVQITCLNACTTKVELRIYRDCSGAAAITPTPLDFLPTTVGCVTPVPLGPWPTETIAEVTPVCPTAITQCNTPGAALLGVQEYFWEREYDFCSNATPCDFDLVWSTCCRNPANTAFTNAGSLSMFYDGFYSHTPGSCNNSPEYTNYPLFVACEGTAYAVHQGAFDADGDSLVYSLEACRDVNANNLVPYQPGYSPTQPLGPSWNVTLDPQSGMLYLDPIPGNIVVGALCIQIAEYRNGQLIGRYWRDVQIIIATCPANNNPLIGTPQVVSGPATINGFQVDVCGTSPICIDIPSSDPDPGQALTYFWSGLAGATFADANLPQVQDTLMGTAPVGRLCFTPPAPGVYQVLLTAEDNACPVLGVSSQVLTINVGAGGQTNATASLVNCLEVNFEATACGGTGNYTYQWSGGGGLSGNTATVNHVYAGQGLYPWQVVISDGATMQDTIRDTLDIGGLNFLPLIQPAGTTYVCQNQPVLLAAGMGYTSYLWSNGATTSTTTVTGAGTYFLTVTDPAGCQFFDSTFVFNTPPQPATLISGLDTLDPCQGVHSVTLDAGAGYGWYTWSTGDFTQTISVTAGGTYSVTVEDANSCQFYDAVYVVEEFPDLYGTILTSTNAPLANQDVILVEFDPATLMLQSVDTTQTDANGKYFFCTVTDSMVRVKALPDSATYPGEMPTYALGTLTWVSAAAYNYPAAPNQVNFGTIAGQNPGGPGFIGGLVTQGANRTAGPGDAVAHLDLLLYHQDFQVYIGHTQTDANGYFSFGNLPLGNYKVIADFPGVDIVNVPELALSAVANQFDSLDFRLHSSYFELYQAPVAAGEALDPGAQNLDLVPNPTSGQQAAMVYLPAGTACELVLLDAYGRQVAVLADRRLAAGSHSLSWDANALGLADGVYFLRLTTREGVLVRKAILNR